MARAFNGALGERFNLVTCGGEGDEPDLVGVKWETLGPLICNISPYFAAVARAIALVLDDRRRVIFTRDIVVAWITVQLGGRAIYETHRDTSGPVALRLMRALAKNPSFKLVAISKALAEFCKNVYEIPQSRVLVAHDGVFVEDYPAITAAERKRILHEFSVPSNSICVLHTGSLYKGGAELFESILAMQRASLFIAQVGGTRQERERWEAFYRSRGYSRIAFYPPQPHARVRLLQRAADILLYLNVRASPLHWCTSPLKIFEYMASQVPILASTIGSVGEVLDDANAYCFDADKPSTLVDALCELLSNSNESHARAMRAYEDVSKNYTWHSRAAAIIEFAGKGWN